MEKQKYRLIEVPTVEAIQYTGGNNAELLEFIAGNKFELELVSEHNDGGNNPHDKLIARDFDDWSSVVPINGWITLSGTTWDVFSDSNFKEKYEPMVEGLHP